MKPSTRPARSPIRRLDPATVERIAAGEVVERPASVVKELVENSVDAAADTVTIRLENGGLDRIEVSDDGFGIPPEELELAVARHATSKIAPDGPIERIDSLGFRGEALAAIATVARLRLLSRPAERDAAEGVSLVGGEVVGRFTAPRAPGTTVEVEDLFFNTPARRKFLKSPPAEQIEVMHAVERLYLAVPRVALRVEAEGREVANYPSTSDLKDAAARVLGSEILHASIPLAGEIPGGRIRGVIGRPSIAAASARGLYLTVNGRAIVSRPIAQAVRAAFGDYLPRSRFPVGAVHLEIAPETVDVNVHPTKREVRFVRERELADAIRLRVREALVGSPQVAELADRSGPVAEAPPDATPDRAAPAEGAGAAVVVRTAPAQRTLETGAETTVATRVLAATGHPALTLLGCLDELYWVAVSGNDLVLIDQHAASERVLFERLRRSGSLARQELVEPVTVRLTGAERSALSAHTEEVQAAGFEIEPFGPEDHRVRAVPTFRGRRPPAGAVKELLDELAAGGRPTIPDGLAERTTATIACHAAIRAGDPIGREEFAQVLASLYALPEAAYACPHGRPILLRIPRSRLDRWFLRSGS
jgi:DNA mismatch repair protein MutL